MFTGSTCSSFLIICLILWKPVHSVHCFWFVSFKCQGYCSCGIQGGGSVEKRMRGHGVDNVSFLYACVRTDLEGVCVESSRCCAQEVATLSRAFGEDVATQHRCPDVSDLAQKTFPHLVCHVCVCAAACFAPWTFWPRPH